MGWLTSGIVTIGITCSVYLAGSWISRRLARRNDDADNGEPQLFGGLRPPPRFGALTYPLARLMPQSESKLEKLQRELLSSGKFHSGALDDFLATRNLLLIGTITLGAFVFAIGMADGYELVMAGATGVLGVFAFALPPIALSAKASQRVKAIEKGIPDALDMLAMAAASGMSIDRAVGRIADQLQRTHPSMAEELRMVARQSRSGSLAQAFRSFGERIDLPEVAAWCALMVQTERLGGGLVNALHDYAMRIRSDRRQRAERAGDTASIKLLLPVITCLCPPVAIMLIGPAILDLRDYILTSENGIAAAVQQFEESTTNTTSSNP